MAIGTNHAASSSALSAAITATTNPPLKKTVSTLTTKDAR
jgi:hypothetical protein